MLVIIQNLNIQVRYLRPLTKVAVIWDVALICGWHVHVDLFTPRHVGTYTEQVLKLCRWQGRVFVLRLEKKAISWKQGNPPLLSEEIFPPNFSVTLYSPVGYCDLKEAWISTHFIILVKKLLKELVAEMIKFCGAADRNPESDERKTTKRYLT